MIAMSQLHLLSNATETYFNIIPYSTCKCKLFQAASLRKDLLINSSSIAKYFIFQTSKRILYFPILYFLPANNKAHRSHKQQSLQSLYGYIARRTEMPDYPDYLAEGSQIGPGPPEPKCKCLTSHLKGHRHRWNRNTIDAHLSLSCLQNNPGQRAEFCPKALNAKYLLAFSVKKRKICVNRTIFENKE
jgi:hypothetical protein